MTYGLEATAHAYHGLYSIDEELRLLNAYLAAENRILRNQITGRVQLTGAERKTLAEIGKQLGRQTLEEIATIAKPATILAWHRKNVAGSLVICVTRVFARI
jgi:putative transposase